MPTRPEDENRHVPGTEPGWEESWYFDLATDDASLGMFVRLALLPAEGVAWYWAYLARSGEPLVIVRDHEVDLPRGSSLEVRASGLWADMVCETAMEHWTLGLEAFGVALDDPDEVYRGERGDRTSLGTDLEWESTGEPLESSESRYEQACTVHGDLLVGAQRVEISATGHRIHEWGPSRWRGGRWSWAAGNLGPGRPFVAAPDDDVCLSVEGGEVKGTVTARAPVLLPSTGNRLTRALCLFTAGDGSTGSGWAEWLEPEG